MLQARGLTRIYRTDEVETTAVRQVDLTVEDGEFLSVMGPSGCGKSTLLNLLGLLDAPTSGEYDFFEQRVSGRSERYLSRLRKGAVGFIFQDFNLMDELTVAENVALPLLYLRVPATERRRRVDEVLERLDIAHRSRHVPGQLSGGQQQRVAIGRAVVMRPRLIVADEPTGNLDTAQGESIMGLLNELNRDGATVVMVTHSADCAAYADRIVHLLDGEITRQETTTSRDA